jgi:hypothetical protein
LLPENTANNFNAEAEAVRHAAKALIKHKMYAKKKGAIFKDALSIVTALKSQHTNGLVS